MKGLRHSSQISDDGHYIRVVLEGILDEKSAAESALATIKLIQATGIDRVLIDARKARNVASTIANVRYARPIETPADKAYRDAKQVIIVDCTDRSHDIAIRSLQLKGHNIRICHDEEHAIKMLTEPD
tara:strand:- start:504 stop:887 length:384 start_codon:yes stop_codon:yes gene_type:complete